MRAQFSGNSSRKPIEKRRGLRALWVVAWAVPVFVAVVAVAFFAWDAITASVLPASRPTLAHCSAISEPLQRLACYDQVAAQHQTNPAKGGVPPLLFPPGERSPP